MEEYKKIRDPEWETQLEHDICPFRDYDLFQNAICELQEGEYCDNYAKYCEFLKERF